MVRRALPFGPPAALFAFLVGAAVGGLDAGWSSAIGIAVVFLNFAANGVSIARAARISLRVLYAVALGGVVVRLAAIVGLMAALNTLSFFSPLAFGLAVVPATMLLLAYEMRVVAADSGRWWQIPGERVAP